MNRAVGLLREGTVIPTGFRHESFVGVPLTTDLAALDHACYVASPDVIRVHSGGRWPVNGFTLADDRELVSLHEKDHASRRAFTFLLMTPAETEALGCLYLNPLRDHLIRAEAPQELIEDTPQAAAMVTFWLRQDQQDTGLAEVVADAVHAWLLEEWPLVAHVFRVLPGERSSRAALERLGLQRRWELPGDPHPYLWYR